MLPYCLLSLTMIMHMTPKEIPSVEKRSTRHKQYCCYCLFINHLLLKRIWGRNLGAIGSICDSHLPIMKTISRLPIKTIISRIHKRPKWLSTDFWLNSLSKVSKGFFKQILSHYSTRKNARGHSEFKKHLV